MLESVTFAEIPGSPIAYWANYAELFSENKPLVDHCTIRQGLITGDNERFVRYWFEVDSSSIGYGFSNRASACESRRKCSPTEREERHVGGMEIMSLS